MCVGIHSIVPKRDSLKSFLCADGHHHLLRENNRFRFIWLGVYDGDRFHPSIASYATWRRRKNTNNSINIRISTPLSHRRTRFTTNSVCSTDKPSGLERLPVPGEFSHFFFFSCHIKEFKRSSLAWWQKFDDIILHRFVAKRYPNGNGASLGLTTGVGAGSPPYTPLPGATSPDQTPLCHQISSNDGSYNHKKGKSQNSLG